MQLEIISKWLRYLKVFECIEKLKIVLHFKDLHIVKPLEAFLYRFQCSSHCQNQSQLTTSHAALAAWPIRMSFRCQIAQFVRLTIEIHSRRYAWHTITKIPKQIDTNKYRIPKKEILKLVGNIENGIQVKSNLRSNCRYDTGKVRTAMDPPLEHPVLPSPTSPTNSVQLFDMKSAANCQKLLNILHVRVELSQQRRKGGGAGSTLPINWPNVQGGRWRGERWVCVAAYKRFCCFDSRTDSGSPVMNIAWQFVE